MPLFQEQGYAILKQSSISITTDEGNSDINNTVYLHNAGVNTVYIDIYTGVDNTKWELEAGEKLGPLSIQKLYFVGAGVSTLKVLHLRGC